MDLGIGNKTAIVCASSKGLGYGCAQALAQAGVNLIICARGSAQLAEAHGNLEKFNVSVKSFVVDVTSKEGQKKILEVGRDADILVTNAGGPPPGHWSEWQENNIASALNDNMLTPISLILGIMPQMIEKKWGRIVNITSQSVKAPIHALGLSNTARSGLTGFVAGVSRQVASEGIVMNNLLPGSHDTDRIKALNQSQALKKNISEGEVKKYALAEIPVGRYGTTEEFGAICAFLCSIHVGFLVGQNILVDGGNVNMTF
mgnify:CR=1 FL=1